MTALASGGWTDGRVPEERVEAPGRTRGDRGSDAASDFLVLDSCHSTWLFDVSAKRFRRILKGLDLDPSVAATDWRSYERLELSEDSDAFVVVLNAAGTRRIRSWRHVDGCEQCEGERTAELSLDDIRRFALA